MLLQALEIKQTTESIKTIVIYAIVAENFNRVMVISNEKH